MEQPVSIGRTNVKSAVQHGFSYIELMVSILIISTGFVGYLELIARIKSTQYFAATELQNTLQLNYEQQIIRINRSVCLTPQVLNTSLPIKTPFTPQDNSNKITYFTVAKQD